MFSLSPTTCIKVIKPAKHQNISTTCQDTYIMILHYSILQCLMSSCKTQFIPMLKLFTATVLFFLVHIVISYQRQTGNEQ